MLPVNRIPRPVSLTRQILENGIPLGGSTRLVLKRGIVKKGSTSHTNFTDLIGSGNLQLQVGDYIHHVTVYSNSADSTIGQTFSIGLQESATAGAGAISFITLAANGLDSNKNLVCTRPYTENANYNKHGHQMHYPATANILSGAVIEDHLFNSSIESTNGRTYGVFSAGNVTAVCTLAGSPTYGPELVGARATGTSMTNNEHTVLSATADALTFDAVGLNNSSQSDLVFISFGVNAARTSGSFSGYWHAGAGMGHSMTAAGTTPRDRHGGCTVRYPPNCSQ